MLAAPKGMNVTTPSASERFDKHCKCLLERSTNACSGAFNDSCMRPLPLTQLDDCQMLLRLATSKWPEKKWSSYRRLWMRIFGLYTWLDPRHKGYIELIDVSSWLQRLWIIREKACVGSSCSSSGSDNNVPREQHAPHCRLIVRTLIHRASATKLSIIDVLVHVLTDIPSWIGNRSVVEKSLFLETMFKLMTNGTTLNTDHCTTPSTENLGAW